ncbi:hypothetical protein RIF29_38712 [Crotalaria pallida]|uniref:Uncharacterized protein n=1 Tax=Crotalaria pallida TaxID=3830 RepID=A0AAN9HP14_CROPI
MCNIQNTRSLHLPSSLSTSHAHTLTPSTHRHRPLTGIFPHLRFPPPTISSPQPSTAPFDILLHHLRSPPPFFHPPPLRSSSSTFDLSATAIAFNLFDLFATTFNLFDLYAAAFNLSVTATAFNPLQIGCMHYTSKGKLNINQEHYKI